MRYEVKGPAAILTIDRVEMAQVRGADHLKPAIHFQNSVLPPLLCNLTNWDNISAIAGTDDAHAWGGTRIVLYVDPRVSGPNGIVSGIRVRPPQVQKSKPNQSADDDDVDESMPTVEL